MCSLEHNQEIVCREKEHDERCAGRENVPITHARLITYYKRGKRYFYIRGVCEVCMKYLTDTSEIMTVAEAVRRRDLQRELNGNGRTPSNGRTEMSSF